MARDHADLSFAPAPACGRVRITTALPFGVVLGITALFIGMAVQDMDREPAWVTGLRMALAPGLGLLVISLIWVGARVRAFRLVGAELIVDRRFHKPRFALAGLESIELDRAAMEGARKQVGNDGLGAIAGRFRSKKLGAFRVYLTNPQNAVVLRWPGQTLVVSPDRSFEFIEAVRERAGLKS
jgi:hypothetical protein